MGIKWELDVIDDGGVATLRMNGELLAQKVFEDISKCGDWIKEAQQKLKEGKIKPVLGE